MISPAPLIGRIEGSHFVVESYGRVFTFPLLRGPVKGGFHVSVRDGVALAWQCSGKGDMYISQGGLYVARMPLALAVAGE
jgi:hypothetical protein